MIRKTRKAFTLTEMMIAMIVVGIVGAASATGLWFALNTFFQLEDYTTAEAEIERAFQRLAREFTMIGLGMPNNVQGAGSFAQSFRGSAPPPLTVNFGPPVGTAAGNALWAWGGPVTVAGAASTATQPAQPWAGAAVPDVFVGPQLFYAWSVPTGVRVHVDLNANPAQINTATPTALQLEILPHARGGASIRAGVEVLRNDFGLRTLVNDTANGGDMRTWLFLPTLRLPMRAQSFNIAGTNSTLDVVVVPNDGGGALDDENNVTRPLMGLDEVHLMRAARLFLNNNGELRRALLTANGNIQEEILANNIIGVGFVFNPADRLLTMSIAAQGYGGAVGAPQPVWPAEFGPLLDGPLGRRVAVRTLSWRIRN